MWLVTHQKDNKWALKLLFVIDNISIYKLVVFLVPLYFLDLLWVCCSIKFAVLFFMELELHKILVVIFHRLELHNKLKFQKIGKSLIIL